VPLSDTDLVGLILLDRSAGHYSATHGKPLWLWAAANNWGLSQACDDRSPVSDAVANRLYLALLVKHGGSKLQGITYWNYNVKDQGLYNDSHETAYDIETMFGRLSAALPRLRRAFRPPPWFCRSRFVPGAAWVPSRCRSQVTCGPQDSRRIGASFRIVIQSA
jgi:hypothetical protein